MREYLHRAKIALRGETSTIEQFNRQREALGDISHQVRRLNGRLAITVLDDEVTEEQSFPLPQRADLIDWSVDEFIRPRQPD